MTNTSEVDIPGTLSALTLIAIFAIPELLIIGWVILFLITMPCVASGITEDIKKFFGYI